MSTVLSTILKVQLSNIMSIFPDLKRVFLAIKLSLNGEQQDYTKGSIPKAVILLAIPMILELSLESVFAVVDMFFVSKLGETAIATVGLTESVITIIYGIGIGLGTAATAIVSRRTGEKNSLAAAHAGAQAIVLGIVISLVLSAAGIIFSPEILFMMGANEEVVSEGVPFTRIMMGGSLSIMMLFLINGIFRGAGDAAMAMKSLWIACFINIILCPVFIHFYGLTGAAIATVIGRSSGVLYQCYYLFRGIGVVKLRKPDFTIQWDLIKSIIVIAWPATFQFLVASGSWIILTKLVAETGGTTATAGYQIAFRNFIFFILPAWGLSNAAATLVGQNLGANEIQRAEQSVFITAKYTAILMSFVTLLLLLFSEAIIRIFSQDEAVVKYGVQALRIIGAGYIFYGTSMVMTAALNGAGDTKTPTIIHVICFWLFQIPLAYMLAFGLQMKATGVFIAVPSAEVLISILGLYYFKKGKWKQVKV